MSRAVLRSFLCWGAVAAGVGTFGFWVPAGPGRTLSRGELWTSFAGDDYVYNVICGNIAACVEPLFICSAIEQYGICEFYGKEMVANEHNTQGCVDPHSGGICHPWDPNGVCATIYDCEWSAMGCVRGDADPNPPTAPANCTILI